MSRRLSILIVMVIVISISLYAQKDSVLRAKNQEYINKGTSLPERFNRIGEVFVQTLKNELEDIVDHDKWKEYGLQNKKIYLFISFNKVQKGSDMTLEGVLGTGSKAMKLFKTAVYDMLANAIKSAINNDQNLKKYIVTLSADPRVLKAAIAETGDPMYNPTGKLSSALMDSMNANYHFFFEPAIPNKIYLSGGVDIIEINREIASTFNYEMDAGELFNEYQPLQTPPAPPGLKEIQPGNTPVNPLPVSIICKRRGETDGLEISPNTVFYTGDRIWFDITLPQLGGYFLVYAQDSRGNVFNLFPGTTQAVKEGKFKFPYHLENYTTEVLKTAREQSQDLPKNKIRIGGYTLDENTGSENIFFYYANERNEKLEKYLLDHAKEVGKDIQFKGFDNSIEKYTPGDVNASISKPLLHYTETHLSLKHE
jgi:hypothetical protein